MLQLDLLQLLDLILKFPNSSAPDNRFLHGSAAKIANHGYFLNSLDLLYMRDSEIILTQPILVLQLLHSQSFKVRGFHDNKIFAR